MGVLLFLLVCLHPCSSLQHNPGTYPGPARGNTTSWHVELQQWRQTTLASIRYNASIYDNQLLWTQSSYVHQQVMMHERSLFDWGVFRVSQFLSDAKVRYGGVNSVLLWPTYTNMGIDDRNQWDLSMALGDRLTIAVDLFHAHGVAVLFPYNPWDTGTRDTGVSVPTSMASLLKYTHADGFNGDTMSGMNVSYYGPSVLEPEELYDPTDLWCDKWAWGYWQNATTQEYNNIPVVDRMRYLEPRHMTHVTDRWSRNKTPFIQLAWFNGAGVNTWENVWGIFNQMTARDCELVRRVATMSRFFTSFLTAKNAWVPHVQEEDWVTESLSLYGSRWDIVNGKHNVSSLWTIVNRSLANATFVLHQKRTNCYDCYRGKALLNANVFPIAVEANGVSCVVCLGPGSWLDGFEDYLIEMRKMTANPLSTYSDAFHVTLQTMVPIARATNNTNMIAIPHIVGFPFVVSGNDCSEHILIKKSFVLGPWKRD
jgi:iron(II)-dependent oxidoreductase